MKSKVVTIKLTAIQTSFSHVVRRLAALSLSGERLAETIARYVYTYLKYLFENHIFYMRRRLLILVEVILTHILDRNQDRIQMLRLP